MSFTIWLTGLPGAGKTTIALGLAAELAGRGRPVEVLDGDGFRETFGRGLGFSREDRLRNLALAAEVAALLNRHGVAVVAAFVSPYRAGRDACRRRIPRFAEVHVDCPPEVCRERDPKGLYRRALAGEIPAFTGVDDPYEPPVAPEVRVATHRSTPDACVRAVLAWCASAGWIPPAAVTDSPPGPYTVPGSKGEAAR